MRIVVDTSVVVSAMTVRDTAPRAVLALCLERKVQPLVGNALFNEYLDVFGRDRPFERCPLGKEERHELLAALAAVSEWVPIRYLWRPNLVDEADNHLVDLAIAGRADWIVTGNVRDLRSGELRFDHLKIGSAGDFMTAWNGRWSH